MKAIKSRNTKPELMLRALLRRLGFPGYRLHRKDLPGKPDVAYIGRKKAIFVHGCFWHGHPCKNGYHLPQTNPGYWGPKIERNMTRDKEHIAKLEALGWSVLIVWECELNKVDIKIIVKNFMEN